MTYKPALRDMICSFDPRVDIEGASMPPASWYTEKKFFELDRRSVLKNSWQPVARASQLKETGSYIAGNSWGEPWIVCKDDAGDIRALYNACRHHATVMLSGEGNCDHIQCPYHGWTYKLSGELFRAPGAGKMRNFDRKQMSLQPIPATIWGDLVFICFGASPPNLGEDFSPIPAWIWDDLEFVKQTSYTVEANWKVVVDNYLDGGYHVPVLHKALATNLDMSSYKTELHKKVVLQAADADSGRLGRRAVYVWAYPGLMLNRYGPILDVNRIIPVSENKTQIIYDFYFESEQCKDTLFVEQSIKDSEQVQAEDTWICKRVQEGLGSSSYSKGRYAPNFEGGEFLFHKLLFGDYSKEM